MEQEGVIKYQQNWNQSAELPDFDIAALLEYRNKCFENEWIGFDKTYKVGYGNISLRYKNNPQFFISGSQTGHIPKLNKTHLSFIQQFNKPLWEKHKNILPTTNPQIQYGTPEMAVEVTRLFETIENKNTGILIMGGHEDGIISWASNFEPAFELLKNL